LLTILPYPVDPNDSVSLRPYWDGGLAVLPAAQLAVEHVNQDPNTLPGYRVELLNIDGGCNVFSRALTNFVEQIHCGTPIAGVIGPGCSDSSLAISSILGRPEISLPNIHLATSSLLQNRTRYPNSHGILSSSFTIINATFSLIRYNGWQKVAIFYDSTVFVHLSPQLRKVINQELQTNNIVFYSLVSDTYFPFEALIKSSARVIVTWTSLAHAQKLLCIAHDRGMVFPHYQWVISGFDIREFLAMASEIVFNYSEKLYNCSSKLMILKNNLILSYTLDSVDREASLISGYTYNKILLQYVSKIQTYNKINKELSISPSIWATITYDAVWALVLAMNMSTVITRTPRNTNSLSFGIAKFTDEINQNLEQNEFAGASGYIRFDSASGYTHRTVDIIHINNSIGRTVVGFADGGSISILVDSPHNIIFINTDNIITSITIHTSVAAIFLIFILTLFVAAFLIHILSIVKRKDPSIKASSPILNHFIFFGCYTWTAASVLYILIVKTLNLGDDRTYANCCHAIWVWLMPMGMSLTIGTLFARTWRIYKIFIHFQNPGRLISNQALITLVLIQLGIDVVLGTIWSVVSPVQTENLNKEVTTGNRIIQSRERTCVFTSNGTSYVFWLSILYCYKALQILSLFTLTLLTGEINNKRFTTVLLRKASYLIFALYVSLIPTFTVLWYINAEIHADVIVMCVLISSTMSVCVLLVLLPPAIPILKKISLSVQ
jgi:gamma-aminobutyric acid type B receptor